MTIWTKPSMIDHLATERSQLLERHAQSLLGGRLLLCYYEENNHNWAAAQASGWFFDGHDNPPWDTWVGRCDDALVAWVPAAFVGLAQQGIDTECVRMLDWADAAPRVAGRLTPEWLEGLALEVRASTTSSAKRTSTG